MKATSIGKCSWANAQQNMILEIAVDITVTTSRIYQRIFNNIVQYSNPPCKRLVSVQAAEPTPNKTWYWTF